MGRTCKNKRENAEREPSPSMPPDVRASGRRLSSLPSVMEGEWPGLQHSLLGRDHLVLMAFGPHTYGHSNKSSQRAKVFQLQSSFPSSILYYLRTVLVLGSREKQHRRREETEAQRSELTCPGRDWGERGHDVKYPLSGGNLAHITRGCS